MFVHRIDGCQDEFLELRELVTETTCRAVCASGYVKTPGRIVVRAGPAAAPYPQLPYIKERRQAAPSIWLLSAVS